MDEQLSCPYKRTDNAYPRYLDTIVSRVTDEIACEKQCTFYEDFLCRSFAFYASASQCFISGDDKASASDGALQSRPGTDYFERSCENIFSSVVSYKSEVSEYEEFNFHRRRQRTSSLIQRQSKQLDKHSLKKDGALLVDWSTRRPLGTS